MLGRSAEGGAQSGSVERGPQARTCPICRQRSYFVTPSVVWPSTGEERDRIIAGYKAKLSTIDCRNFSFGVQPETLHACAQALWASMTG